VEGAGASIYKTYKGKTCRRKNLGKIAEGKLPARRKAPRFPCSQSGYAGGENSFLEQMERTK